ncbi:MAG: hypothetical protein RL346_131 [Verrucomicrobiota bacterium]|jgi:membrane-bound ClpP family serine protease
MSIVILFFSIGLVLLFLEVIIPGGILGITGTVSLFIGCVFSFSRLGTTQGLIAIGIALLAGAGVFYLQFHILPKTRLGRRFFLKHQISASSNALPEHARDLIGKTATSVTVLSPTGYVMIEGKTFEASSRSGQIPKDTELEVIAATPFHLTVRTKA